MKDYLKNIGVHCIYYVFCFFPRDRKRVVFIGWHKTADGEILADNAKYFYLYMSQQKSVRAIWLAKSRTTARILNTRGFESYYEKSFVGIWHALRAQFTVIDAFLQPYNFLWTGTSRIIQLLHGKGMKKKGYSEPQLRKADMIFNTSPFAISLLPENFKKGADLVVSGYSRNDQFFHPITGSDIGVDTTVLNHLKSMRDLGKKNILYAPTFRRGEKEFQFNAIDTEKLRVWAQDKNAHFLLSLHNKYRNQQQEHRTDNFVSTLSEGDIYPLLDYIDVLITDYSSSFVDFLLLDRPIVFYPYDLESYSAREGIVTDYNTITPGPKVFTFEDLLITLEEITKSDQLQWKDSRKRIRELYHVYTDGNSSQRIWEALEKKYLVK